MVEIVSIHLGSHYQRMRCEPKTTSVVGDTGRCIFNRVFVNHLSCIHYFPLILVCHLLNKIIGNTLDRTFMWIAHPDILSIKSDSTEMTVLIHAECNHVFPTLFIHHHQFTHTVIFCWIGSDQYKLIRQTDSLRSLRFAENILIQEIIFTRRRHSRDCNRIIETVIQTL